MVPAARGRVAAAVARPVVLGDVVVADDPAADDRVGHVARRGPDAEGAGEPFDELAEELRLEVELRGPVLERLDVERADVGGEPAAALEAVIAAGREEEGGERGRACGERRGPQLEKLMLATLKQHPGVRPQYVAAVDPETLEPVEHIKSRVLLAVAAFVGSTRLIDNLLVEVAQ